MRHGYRFLKRLIDRVTSVSQSPNDSFVYHGHSVTLQSGTRDYVAVTVCKSSDLYSGSLAEFNFDFWTKELIIEYADNELVENAVIQAFKRIYNHITIKQSDYDN